jgi:hypothetical protein
MLSTNSSNPLPSESKELFDKTVDEAHKCGLGLSQSKPNDNEIHATLDPQFTPHVLRLKFNQGSWHSDNKESIILSEHHGEHWFTNDRLHGRKRRNHTRTLQHALTNFRREILRRQQQRTTLDAILRKQCMVRASLKTLSMERSSVRWSRKCD